MSDFSELFTPSSDPKHLTPEAFIAKEEGNLKTAIGQLPAEMQQFASIAVTDLSSFGAVVANLAGTSVGQVIANDLPTFEAWIANIFTRAGAGAISPAAQTVAAQIAAALSAMLQHMATRAGAGLAAIPGAVLPPPGA